MKKAILITGTPGTGKTVISKLLHGEGFPFVEVGRIVKDDGLYEYFDEVSDSYVVNDELLNSKLIELLEKNISSFPLVIDGHVVTLQPEYVLHCIVLRCSIRHLRERLEERDYSESKIDENVEAEIMEVLLTEMLELYGPERVSVIQNDNSVEDTFKQILMELKTVVDK